MTNGASTTPFLIIAIDGGAASGKSSTSRAIAAHFNFLHVDTGSHYRTLTAALIQKNAAPNNLPAIKTALAQLTLSTRVTGNSSQILINNTHIPDPEIRSAAVNASVSLYAAIPEIRSALLNYQRSQAQVARDHRFNGLVMEGRDIGSVIFPDADLRFFLHADPEARAKRRAAEGQQDSIAERDRRDSTRQTAPLKCPEGATSIDSTHLTLDQVVAHLITLITPRLKTK